MADERVRVEVGFDGGQILSALVLKESADRLERALDGATEGSVTLEAQDAAYTIALNKVVYLKRFARESRVGFGDL